MDMAVKDISHLNKLFLFDKSVVEQAKDRIDNDRKNQLFTQEKVAWGKRYTCAVFRIVL